MSLEEIKKLTADLHSKLESKADDAQNKEAIDKIQKELDKHEAANAKVAQEFVKAQNEAKEFKEKIEALESKMFRTKPTNILEKSAEMKAFESFILKDEKNLSIDEVKYLRTDSDPDGGYLAPPEYVNEIIKQITEISRIRSVARVRSTSKGLLEFPKRTTLMSAYIVGEGATLANSESKYGMEKITVYKAGADSQVTVEMLQDSEFNIDVEINADFALAHAVLEGSLFVNGTGVGEPEGFMTNSSVASINSGVANAITADSLIEITGELKTGYNPVYVLNRKTIANIRQLKDGNGQYLWAAGIANNVPNTINGTPYIEVPDMPDEGAGLYPVAYGDFMRGYTIADGRNLTLIRDNYTLKKQGKVEFTLMKRIGGKVTLAEAIKKIKCSV